MQMLNYVRATTIDEAIKAAHEVRNSALYFAGGTDILVNSRENECYKDRSVIDIFEIDELKGIEDLADYLRIGSMSTHSEIVNSKLVNKYANVLALASASIGALQIQNHSTIAGNIANASPAADTFAPLTLLDAKVEIRRGAETLLLPLYDVVTGPYKTSLEPTDLITAVQVKKLPEGSVCDFYKLGRRRALAISRMTVATVLSLDADGRVSYFDMTLGATFPRPQRFDDVSALLTGKVPTEEDVAATAKALSNKIPEIAGIRHSTKYKQPVAERQIDGILRRLLWREKNDK